LDIIPQGTGSSVPSPAFQPALFFQRLVCDGYPPERVGNHFVAIRGRDGAEVAKAKVAFDFFTRWIIYSESVRLLHERWAGAEGSGEQRMSEALAFLSGTRWPAEWHGWLAVQLLVHFIARDESRRVGRKVTVETSAAAPHYEFQFRTRDDESDDEALKRFDEEATEARQALEAARLAREAGRALKNGGLHLAVALEWFVDTRGATAAAAARSIEVGRSATVQESASVPGAKVHRSDGARRVNRARQEIKNLLKLITLKLPSTP
jgi:hypothetical protein